MVPKRNRVLVIGASRAVLAEAVDILRADGYTADATSDFDRVLDTFDAAALDFVVLGGMVPPEIKQHLREQIFLRNACAVFIQGLSGIPGLIAAQVRGAAGLEASEVGLEAEYEASTRSLSLRLDRPLDVTVVAWWGTSFVPPDPKSTSKTLLEGELAAGPYTVPIPDEVPTQAAFATVSAGSYVGAFIVGGMPPGTTRASFPDAGQS